MLDTNLELLNKNAPDFFYCVGGRNYVHSTTFVALAMSITKFREVSITLNKTVRSGFTFAVEPGEDDLGYLEINYRVYYIKPTVQPLVSLQETDCNQHQKILFQIQQLVVSTTLVVTSCSNDKHWSKKLTAFCPFIFPMEVIKSIEMKRVMIDEKYSLNDVLINGTLAWRQMGCTS